MVLPRESKQCVPWGTPMEQLCLRQMAILSGSLGDCVENVSGSVPGHLRELQATGDECWSLNWGPSAERVHCLPTPPDPTILPWLPFPVIVTVP